MSTRSCILAVCCMLLCWGPAARADLVVRGYDPLLHDRFNSNNSQFIGNPYDWSGVARTSGDRWGTMISANYFLSATHLAPAIGDTMIIYGSNDISGPQQSVTVIGGQQIAGSDLWLGQIDQATNFTTYSIANASLEQLMGWPIYMFGRNTSYPMTAQMTLGRNTVEDFIPNFSHPVLGASKGDVFLYNYDEVGGTGADEARVTGGDSGAPSFIIVDNKPVLIGIHWFAYGPNPGETGPLGSGDTAVVSFVNALNQAMVGQQLSVIAVPEPGTMTLLGLPVAAWCLTRARRHWTRQPDAA